MATAASRFGATMLRRAAQAPIASSSRSIHSTVSRSEISKFSMPAMSPTMTEGGLATWKVKEGQSFSAGDVLLEIETDKATMDVEAQDDGIMAKIVVEAGAKNVQVGKTIAMLAEEGDDISNVEVSADDSPAPKQEAKKDEAQKSASSSQPTSASAPGAPEAKKDNRVEQATTSPQQASSSHAPDLGRTLFPSVARLLVENHVSKEQAQGIKGTGVRGMLTKGDVLAFLGQASTPTGSYKDVHQGVSALGGPPAAGSKSAAPKQAQEPLDANAVRSLIFAGLAGASHAQRAKEAASRAPQTAPTSSEGNVQKRSAFDELLGDYEFAARMPPTSREGAKPSEDAFSGLL